MSMPPAPMPPPLGFHTGPFEGVEEGPPIGGRDDYDSYGGRDTFDDYDGFNQKPKKNKKNKLDKAPVEEKYEGFMLEKAQPRTGEKESWARIGKRTLPFDEKQLVNMAKSHRLKTRTGPSQDFKQLSSNQQGVVTRLIEEQKRFERNKNADWILHDVQRFGKWHWTSMEVKKIQVILKRVDKTLLSKNVKNLTTRSNKTSYQEFEIIDLALDPDKKKGGKKAKKSKSLDDLDPLDDPLGLGMGIPQIVPDHGRDHQMPRQSRDHFDPMPPPPPMGPPGGPPMGPPPGAIPIDQHGPNQFQPPFQRPFPVSARQSFHDANPFQPNPEVASPAQFDDGHGWPHPHHGGMDRVRARSQSRPRERRPSARRPSVDAKKFRQLEDRVDDLNYKMSNWRMGSESSDYEDESIFSSPPSDGQSFSPPSSPRSHFSDMRPKGSLERRRSSTSRDPRYHVARYRSHRYQDTEIEPASSYPYDRRRESPEYRRHSKRPSLHHTSTFDDYPNGRGAEQRYLPAPPRPMRRLTEGQGDNYDYREFDDYRRQGDARDFRDGRDSRRRQSRDFDPLQEAYEAGRRDSMFEGSRRRSSYVGGGGGDYYR